MALLSKGGLGKALSKLEAFEKQKVREEQYATPSELAASLLWQAFMLGDIQDKRVVDLGAGTGILGIGAALLGGNVTLLEKDKTALTIAKKNAQRAGARVELVHDDISSYQPKFDTVIMNPPFGTKTKHADAQFLHKAVQLAPVVWTMHKSSTRKFIINFATKQGWTITHEEMVRFPLPRTHTFHKKPVAFVEVTVFRLQSLAQF